MKRQTDDEWLESARARFAREGAGFDIDPDLSPHEGPTVDPFVRGNCPSCEGRPELERMPYSAMPSPVPAQVCSRCLGIWSPPGSVSSGVAIKPDMHAAYRVSRAPSNCAECFGPIMPDGACSRCKKRAPALPCPVCDADMQRTQFARDWLDYCAACKGTWYGTGELPAIFGVTEDVNRLVVAMHAQTSENLALNGMVTGSPPPPRQRLDLDCSARSSAPSFGARRPGPARHVRSRGRPCPRSPHAARRSQTPFVPGPKRGARAQQAPGPGRSNQLPGAGGRERTSGLQDISLTDVRGSALGVPHDGAHQP